MRIAKTFWKFTAQNCKLLSQKLYMDHNCQQEVKSSAPRREKRWPQGDYKPFL